MSKGPLATSIRSTSEKSTWNAAGSMRLGQAPWTRCPSISTVRSRCPSAAHHHVVGDPALSELPDAHGGAQRLAHVPGPALADGRRLQGVARGEAHHLTVSRMVATGRVRETCRRSPGRRSSTPARTGSKPEEAAVRFQLPGDTPPRRNTPPSPVAARRDSVPSGRARVRVTPGSGDSSGARTTPEMTADAGTAGGRGSGPCGPSRKRRDGRRPQQHGQDCAHETLLGTTPRGGRHARARAHPDAAARGRNSRVEMRLAERECASGGARGDRQPPVAGSESTTEPPGPPGRDSTPQAPPRAGPEGSRAPPPPGPGGRSRTPS